MKLELLKNGQADGMDILSADAMDLLAGGDMICKRRYNSGNTQCRHNYMSSDNGTVICQRGYRSKFSK